MNFVIFLTTPFLQSTSDILFLVILKIVKGDAHMTSTLREVGFGVRVKAKNKMLLDIEKWGVSKCSGRPIVTFLLKKIGFALWPEIMLSQKLIYYWQEIFFLTLALDSEAILWLYHCIVCEVNQTVERVINLNVTWLGFVFALILSAHIHCAVVVPQFVYVLQL